jgi:hypothetical protein
MLADPLVYPVLDELTVTETDGAKVHEPEVQYTLFASCDADGAELFCVCIYSKN